MADVARKQQTTAQFLPTIVTRTRRHTQLTKLTNLMGNLCCALRRTEEFSHKTLLTHQHENLKFLNRPMKSRNNERTWKIWENSTQQYKKKKKKKKKKRNNLRKVCE
jgi:hypothetical protein